MSSPVQDLFGLPGRLAVVTGASQGIGLAIATSLAAAGADIIGISTRMPVGDSAVRRAVEAQGRTFEPVALDLSEREAVQDAARGLSSRDVDILVNNGGTIRRAASIQHTDDDWDHVVDVNLRACFVLSREIGRSMVERGSGRIIMIASMLSFQGGIGVVSYTASKSGIAGLTRALANEWAGSGVNVNAIAPGYIATANTAALVEDEVRHDQILQRVPAGRWGRSEDIGPTAVFLASPAASYVHGAIIPVDGGWLSR